jgi:hypothetical protein
VHADHRYCDGPERCGTVAADGVLDRERDGGEHGRQRGGDRGRRDHRGAAGGQEPAHTEEDRTADPGPDDRHVQDVEAERGQPTVGEEQRLDPQHDGHTERTDPRPDEHGRQHPPEQVAAGATGHREVQHLDGEDEGRDQAGQRDLPVVELVTRLAHADGDAADGDDAHGRRRAGVDEPVG